MVPSCQLTETAANVTLKENLGGGEMRTGGTPTGGTSAFDVRNEATVHGSKLHNPVFSHGILPL